MDVIQVVEVKEGELHYYVVDGCIHIAGLKVKPEYRRRGVASILIDMVSQETGLVRFTADGLSEEGRVFVEHSLSRNHMYRYEQVRRPVP